ncbi:unnamed protein product [Owenia fusiformis]|uniref:Metalloendopeptidase n=1 Tax=Owenia fusiformis TaxID=6347 RepID=A0A8J1Y0L8_OWEFU|nr:unnamed protein product [Owenia fusiformis]
MNSLTFKYLLLIIGLIGTHCRPSTESEESEESSNEIDDDDETPDQVPHNDKETEGELVEGDILSSGGVFRNANVQPKMWPGGEVFYEKPRTTTFSSGVIDNITQAMADITAASGNCIVFKERTIRTGKRNYIQIKKDRGCFSKVGMVGGPQPLSLGLGCYKKGVIIHEFLHALGVNHEHTRHDRDQHIEVKKNNVLSLDVYNNNFKKRIIHDDYGIPYCYMSIMHYSNTAFSKSDNDKTIIPLINPSLKLGQRVKLDSCDIKLLKEMYKCTPGKGSGIPKEDSSDDSYSSYSSYSLYKKPGT